MGAGWRRLSEQAKQKWHLGGERDFQATPNTRNEMMLQEAGEFANHLRKIEKDIRGLKNATECILLSTKAVLSAPLPRVYEETQGGKVVPLNASTTGQGSMVLPIGGLDFNAEELAKISKETSKKLESEVLAPMERWMNAYALVQNRMNKLEALRLEVDSRRRTVAKLGKRVDLQRAKLPQTRAKGEYEMENTIKVLQHKESKLSACRQSYKEHEALVYHQLTNLIRDTVWLKSYLSAVLRVQTEAFQAANVALGQMRTAALPAPSDMGGVPVGVAGSIPSTPDAITAGHDATPPHLQQANMHDVTRKLQRKDVSNGNSMAVSASALGSKDSLYTIQDAPAAPQHRIAAAPSQAYDRYGEQAYGRSGVQAAWS